uniref:Endonuclease/exonuclease/phosphatase domain-containing protein n=1 Tax=Oryzias melastigma TaxID=30732 RepID=A0A3B3CR18_ORYME
SITASMDKENDKQINKKKNRNIIPGRLLLIDCYYHKQKIRIINVYTASNRAKKVQLFKKVNEIIKVGFNVILCGDFNTVTEETNGISATPFKISRESKLLAEICSNASLVDVYRTLHPNNICFTCSDINSKTRIDRTLLLPLTS